MRAHREAFSLDALDEAVCHVLVHCLLLPSGFRVEDLGPWFLVYGLWFKAQGPSRTCNESREEEESGFRIYKLRSRIYEAVCHVLVHCLLPPVLRVWRLEFVVYSFWFLVSGFWIIIYGLWVMVYGDWSRVQGLGFSV